MNFHVIPLCLLITVASGGLSSKSVAGDSKPNVVILFTDDHGTLDLNCFGSDDLMTPNLDALAASGVKFTQAYAHKVCCPARAGLLTGRHPQRMNVNTWTQGDRNAAVGANMTAEEITIAEALKGAGYRTGLFGKWHLGAKVGHGPLDQGFDQFFGHLGGFIDNYRHYFLHGRGFHDLYDGNEEIFRDGEYFPDLMVDEALKFIAEKRDEPFFAYIAFNLPHYPEQPVGKYADAYPDLQMPRQSYARVISTVDDYIGQIIAKLEETGVRENTIIIMMGDNGHSTEDKAAIDINDHKSGFPKGHYYSANGGGGNTGKWIGAKGTFLEGGLRTPAIISYPAKLPENTSRDQVVTVMDWFPTILDLAEISVPDIAFDGHSVLPIIEDAGAGSAYKRLHFKWMNGWAVREGEWKLLGTENKKPGAGTRHELLNLTDEKPEARNYANEKPELVQRLAQLHEEWENDVLLK